MPAKCKDHAGKRYGKLEVIRLIGHSLYGGKRQSLWLCRCDCGNNIELHRDQLPTTEHQLKALMKSGRRLYAECETCRQKTCPVCGDKFSFSHLSYVCPKTSCKETLQEERDRYWKSVERYRLQNDPEYRDEHNAKKRAYYSKSYADKSKWKTWFDQLSEQEKDSWRAKRREWHQEAMKSNPDYREWRRLWIIEWRRKQALKALLADASVLQGILENE